MRLYQAHAEGDLTLYLGEAESPAAEEARKEAMKHPGFKKVQRKIAKKYGMKRAGAILAASSRKASAKAKKRNPRLKRVKG